MSAPSLPRNVVRWAGGPQAPVPWSEVARARGSGGTVWLRDDQGREHAAGAWLRGTQALRAAWLRALDLPLRALAWLFGRGASPRRIAGRRARQDGALVVLVPIAPDLSHTFVYREVLALREAAQAQGRTVHVVVLERGRTDVVHPEAQALLQVATCLPRDGVSRRALRVFAAWLRTPRRTARVFALHHHEDLPGPGHHQAEPCGHRALLGKGALRQARHPGNAFALAAHLRGLGPIVHLHVYGSTYASNAGMLAALLLDVPFSISSYVDFEFDYAHKMLPTKLRLCSFWRTVTNDCITRLRKLAPQTPAAKLRCVLLGLDLRAWPTPASPPQQGRLFSAARLVEKKGLHLVPPALAILRQRGVNLRWAIAGDGEDRERIAAAAQRCGVADTIQWLGPLPSDAVRQELARSDVGLLPCIETRDGERDGIPTFLSEAMALGLPVVTGKVAAVQEAVRDGDTGFVADAHDAAALADAIARALSPAAAAVAQRGRAEVFAHQDVRQTAAQLLGHIADAQSRAD